MAKENRKLLPIERMTPSEYKIFERIIALDEKYFSDMRFEDSKLRKLLKYQIQAPDGKFVWTSSDLPEFMELDISLWSIKIPQRMKHYGVCDNKRKTIRINKKLVGQDLKETLLHELIHFYECSLHEIYIQVLVLHFYEKLIKKIGRKKLWELIQTDKFFLDLASNKTQFHSVLFLFKSLDLDLKLKKSLGTISAYHRGDFF